MVDHGLHNGHSGTDPIAVDDWLVQNGETRFLETDDANSNRSNVLMTIVMNPGLNLKEIAHETGLSVSTVRYHLQRLLGKIVKVRQGHHLLHFSTTLPVKRREALALLRVDSIRSLVSQLMDESNVHLQKNADAQGISVRSVRRNINHLTHAGLARIAAPHSRRRKNVFDVELHPEMRVAWALWCKDADEVPPSPLHQSMGWLFMVDVFIGKLFVSWSQYQEDWR